MQIESFGDDAWMEVVSEDPEADSEFGGGHGRLGLGGGSGRSRLNSDVRRFKSRA